MTRVDQLEPLPYFKWHVKDWRSNRRVQRMSWQARGLYRELLDELWIEGSIPEDQSQLAEICGCTPEEFGRYWPEIAPCWFPIDGGYINEKLERQRTALDAMRLANAKNGKAGAAAKLASAKRSLTSVI